MAIHVGDGKDAKMGAQNASESQSKTPASYMRRLRSDYEDLCRGESRRPFWDVVVIGAGDGKQTAWYEHQLSLKRASGELPPGDIPFLVVTDVGSVRIGDGGATLNILDVLLDRFGQDFYKKKVLLIHAGGYSKRLPNHTFTGKLFCDLPVEWRHNGEPWQVFHMKMCMYWPFLDLMGEGGLFFAASDDLETYFIDENDLSRARPQCQDSQPCIYSLSHPSSLAVGTGHGVFRLEASAAQALTGPAASCPSLVLGQCQRVLQKPSEQLMRDSGMVLGPRQDLVYTDSAFWMNPALLRTLVQFHARERPLCEETSMYSDFMACQGTEPDNGHRKSQETLKGRICSLMEAVDLKILALPRSKFYHIGTLNEYIDAYCFDRQLREEMSFGNLVKSNLTTRPEQSVLMHSLVCLQDGEKETQHIFPPGVVLEYVLCEAADLRLEPNTIITNCHIPESFGRRTLPGGHVYHTVPVAAENGRDGEENGREKKKAAFVTVAFHIEDDLKKKLEEGPEELRLGERPALGLFSDGGQSFKHEDLFGPGGAASLWTARLFVAADTMAGSFEKTVLALTGAARLAAGERRYSMADLIQLQCTEEFAAFRALVRERLGRENAPK